MKQIRMALVALVVLAASPALLACTFEVEIGYNATGGATLSWDPVPGALAYDVFVGTGYSDYRFLDGLFENGHRRTIQVDPQATDSQQHRFMIMAKNNTPFDGYACVGRKEILLEGNRSLAALTHKRIIPFVGSVRGANGSDFRTSLTMTRMPSTQGRIVFRPTGSIANDNDPFIRYQFGDNGVGPDTLHWDDILAAIGATGTGSLEIIPERRQGTGADHPSAKTIPDVTARVYNVNPDGSTFGSRVAAVRPAEWFTHPATLQGSVGVTVPPQTGNYRRNIGFRTLTPVTYKAQIFGDGIETYSFIATLPAGYTHFGSVDAVMGRPVPANARVLIEFAKGYGIAFYTETENSTNDPSLTVANPVDARAQVSWGY